MTGDNNNNNNEDNEADDEQDDEQDDESDDEEDDNSDLTSDDNNNSKTKTKSKKKQRKKVKTKAKIQIKKYTTVKLNEVEAFSIPPDCDQSILDEEVPQDLVSWVLEDFPQEEDKKHLLKSAKLQNAALFSPPGFDTMVYECTQKNRLFSLGFSVRGYRKVVGVGVNDVENPLRFTKRWVPGPKGHSFYDLNKKLIFKQYYDNDFEFDQLRTHTNAQRYRTYNSMGGVSSIYTNIRDAALGSICEPSNNEWMEHGLVVPDPILLNNTMSYTSADSDERKKAISSAITYSMASVNECLRINKDRLRNPDGTMKTWLELRDQKLEIEKIIPDLPANLGGRSWSEDGDNKKR